ncbi:prion-inhibition and propagation domain-containing protein [Hirsutella rhossiliensis]|uniref:Prion-inhibition and propagation domain-containing protein n=1 Tax=Hirsutella rhossiliensis TaxID=111463 RepID=A0A9P8MWS4_9HYPO|nr:prion-inhibition and propagation domain-containing protein [Hirsutella rhossiliensis]KAH0963523.1 prion-inhibition and propagation domain-containing protein [Hirsutella rhossiliensis]
MDPLSIGGLAIGVASLSLQVYTGCIQGIQLLVTALGYEDECKYLNLRLRMEQQRLFAWSETSGLLDLDASNHERILNSNLFNLHRQTILDLLVQVQCLFDDFTSHQRKHNNLRPVRDDDDLLGAPDKDAKQANFPMSDRKRDFIKKAMVGLKLKSHGGWVRLRWSSFDKEAFERLLAKFSALNDNMTNILDHSLQVEIRHTVQDTNRGVLLLHHKIADLSHLVLALKSQLDVGASQTTPAASRVSTREREASMKALLQLAALARFKAFNETIDPQAGLPTHADAAAAKFLELAGPNQPRDLRVARLRIELDPDVEAQEAPRCEALLKATAEDGQETQTRVWIEWKDYDGAGAYPDSLSKEDIVDRVRKLASLLHHSPKPDAFRTPHCLGYFDKADPDVAEDDVDVLDKRLGLIFERPNGDELDGALPPVSLHDILQDTTIRKPRVTERVKLAHALSNCLLYLHAVNWLHKGLRSHNVLFFRTHAGHVDLHQPYLSGFDFSRPGGSDEMTDVPGDDAEHDLYRHPLTQSNRRSDRERSNKSFDVYSLGVILVELAHWKTVDRVLGIDLRRARGNHKIVRQVRERLVANESIGAVGAEMGQRFEGATRACLAGGPELGLHPGEDETADEVAERLSVRYYEDVVKRLGEVVV